MAVSCVFIDWFGYYRCQQSQQAVFVSKETCWKIKITGEEKVKAQVLLSIILWTMLETHHSFVSAVKR